jgi:cyanophycinase
MWPLKPISANVVAADSLRKPRLAAWLRSGWACAILCLAAFAAGQTGANEPAAAAASEPAAAAAGEPRGSLVIIGGSERFRDRELWETIVDLAGGEGARIAIFPTAGGKPPGTAYAQLVKAFERAGGDAFVVPINWSEADRNLRDAVPDPDPVALVRAATGVYFVGGSQGRIVDALRDDRGHDTPMLEAIRSVYEKGGVVAGTSAGAAIMSHVMYRDAPAPLEILREGVQLGRELDHGLGFLPPTWFVEQHCLVRGRFARALVAMHTEKIPHGIGVDENTALVVRRGRHATVIGYKGVLIMDASKAVSDDDAEGFTLTNVTLSYLDRGDAIDLETLAVTPSPEKADETALDPNAADFRPYYDQRMFYTDILGNATVADLMGRLIDNAESEAIGLAFSGLDAQNRPSDGFEFRFYRGPESRGWYTESFGGEDYTVLNIHLDILPIRISGPLYEQRRGRAGDRTMPDNAEPETETKEAVADTPGDEPAAP